MVFRCPVRFWHGVNIENPLDVRRFHTALPELRPRHLDISVDICSYIYRNNGNLVGLIPDSEITHLNVDFFAMYTVSEEVDAAELSSILVSDLMFWCTIF